MSTKPSVNGNGTGYRWPLRPLVVPKIGRAHV